MNLQKNLKCNHLNDWVLILKNAAIMLNRKIKTQLTTKNFKVFKKEKNDLETIVMDSIIENFNRNQFFSPSTGHFNGFFYIRDFWWVAESLKELGFEKEAKKTLEFVLNMYKRFDRITTTVTKNKVFDYPTYGSDSLSALIDVISILDYKLTKDEVEFLNKHLRIFYNLIENHLITPKSYFSTSADHKVKYSDTYSNSMYYLLQKRIKELNEEFNYNLILNDDPEIVKQAILENLFNKEGVFFYDDITKKNYISGDAQIFPFKVGLIENINTFKTIIKRMKQEKLIDKLALRYHSKELFKDHSLLKHIHQIFMNHTNKPKYHFSSIACYRYQTDPYWLLLGINYLDALMKIHKKTNDKEIFNELKESAKKWKDIIELYGRVYELYIDNDKNESIIIYNNSFLETKPEVLPFRSLLYFADSDMIWGAKVLEAHNYVKVINNNHLIKNK